MPARTDGTAVRIHPGMFRIHPGLLFVTYSACYLTAVPACGLARGPAPTVGAFNRSACYLTAVPAVRAGTGACPYSGCIQPVRLFSYAVAGVRAGTGACPYSGCIQPVRRLSYSRSGCAGWHGGLPLQWAHSTGPHVILSPQLRTYAEFFLFDLDRFDGFLPQSGTPKDLSPQAKLGSAQF